jgi:segregation and condensation protein B
MDESQIKYFIEAALLAAGRPLSIDHLQRLFDDSSMPEKAQIRQAVTSLLDDYEGRGITIAEVASGFRIQIRSGMVERLQKLWEERPPRYSRALFETLALIAYRQPMTRGEIEEIRGVTVSPNIIRSLLEREWVRVVGHRDVPGRPEMFGTTRLFLDYFGLKKLEDLPPLADISDWESLRVQLNLPAVEEEQSPDSQGSAEVSELPVLNKEDQVKPEPPEDEGPSAELQDPEPSDDVEPIAATAWPDPNSSAVAMAAADVSEFQEELEEGEDAESSLTGA